MQADSPRTVQTPRTAAGEHADLQSILLKEEKGKDMSADDEQASTTITL